MLHSLLHHGSRRLAVLLALLALSLSLAVHSETFHFASPGIFPMENSYPDDVMGHGQSVAGNGSYYEGGEAARKLVEIVLKTWWHADMDMAVKPGFYSAVLTGDDVRLRSGFDYGIQITGGGMGLRLKYAF